MAASATAITVATTAFMVNELGIDIIEPGRPATGRTQGRYFPAPVNVLW